MTSWSINFAFNKRCITLFLIGLASTALAQFSNEWINYNQSYYKIAVIKNGMHRLTYSDLNAAGVPVNSVDPRRIQIFRRGKEQAINLPLSFQANAQFEPGEYLEFYGERNDGATDVDLYKNPAHHPHPYYNLYSDTAAYFLTWNLQPVQGKRMTQLNPEINVTNLPAEQGITCTILQVYSDQYSGGITYAGLIQSSFFDEGEGWTGPIICTINGGCSGQQDFVVNLPNGVTALAAPQLEVMLVGRAQVGHTAEIYVGSSSLRLVSTLSFQDFQTLKVNVPLQWNDVGSDGSLAVRVKGLGVGGIRESISVSYLKIDYQRDFNLNGLNSQRLTLLPNVGNKSYIEIQNAPVGMQLYDITNLSNEPSSGSIIGTYSAGPNLAAVVSGTASARKIFTSNEFFTPTIKKISFRPINPSSHNYIIISNTLLRKAGLGYPDPVKAYSDYRASAAGGGFDTLLVNIDQLYNQFNYGETSSRAIYQFMKFMANTGNPKYLFLIGKGLELNFTYDRKRAFLSTDLKDLVPTAGYPGSDLIYTAGLKGTTYEPAIPTGRITANTPSEVAAYLNKIIQTEALPFDALWRKNILHLSGGINAGEPQTFKNYVDGFKSTAADLYLGANVETKSKRTLDPEAIPISDQVNAGLSLITFFGHSATTATDFEIGFVTNSQLNYNNDGKYPAFIINGCNVGRIYDNRQGDNRSLGEDWILAQNKGAKAFISHSSYGFEASLRQYTDLFYRSAFADSTLLTKGIGDAQKEVATKLLSFIGSTPNTNVLSIMHQMVLLGDPAVKIFGAPKPDFEIRDEFLSKVSFDGKPITSATRSFGIQYKIRNYGQARADSIRVRLTQTLPDNTIIYYDTLVPPVYYESQLILNVPNPNRQGGQNIFTITLDEGNEIIELNEGNNTASLNLFIPASATYNLVPYHFSIVNTTSVELIFQNTNQQPLYRNYLLELDTVPTFNSSFLMQKKIWANVLGRVTLTLPSTDSVVYYWRTKLDQPTLNESPEWFTTSFSFLSAGAPGWGQLRGSQFSENGFSNLKQSRSETFGFLEHVSTVVVQNFGSANPAPYSNTSIKVNNEELNLGIQAPPCRASTINLVAFEKHTGNAYPAIPFGVIDQRTCGREPQVITSFTLAEAEAALNGLADAITNIAVNDSIVLFTIGDAGVQNYSAALLSALGEAGVSTTQLASFQAGEPLIVFGRKGAPIGAAKVIRSSASPLNQQELVLNETITSLGNTGSMRSDWIGPAKAWTYMMNQVRQVEASDNFSIRVIGLNTSNQEVELYEGNANFVNFAFIDPNIYPKIKLQLTTSDDTNLTPIDLKNWIVKYEPVAEGILLFRGHATPVSLQEGEQWNGHYSFINLTNQEFRINGQSENLSMDLRTFNKDKSAVENQSLPLAAPAPQDSTVFIWPVKTIGRAGINDLTATVNTLSMPEQYEFNNEIQLENYLLVKTDQQPPILDVLVDGRYLVNGDVVSNKPIVQIKILDENVVRYKTDTVGIQIFLKNLDTEVVSRINFTNPNLTWSAASATSDFHILFQTELYPGEYELSVQGADASGNPSGATPYTVSFLVTDELSVVFSEPFPNPSSTQFSFPIRLSVNELPEAMSLKILSPDGRLLRHFSLNDVSGFYVGTNYLKWNAQDLDGINMPNGLYYYKLDLTVAGKGFSNVGRLVLIR